MSNKRLTEQERIKIFDKRLLWLKVAFTLFGLFLAIYLFSVQIIDIKHYSKKAKAQRLSKKFVMRGSILDRNGIKLASDQLSYNVYLHKQYQDHTPEELAAKLSKYLGMSEAELVKKMKSPNSIILLKKDIDRPTVDNMKKLGLREISTDRKNCRDRKSVV